MMVMTGLLRGPQTFGLSLKVGHRPSPLICRGLGLIRDTERLLRRRRRRRRRRREWGAEGGGGDGEKEEAIDGPS